MDRIIFGDNQFFGINHMSEEKAQAQAERFKDISAILQVVDMAYNGGIHGFMFNTHERVSEICDQFRAHSERYKDIRLYVSMPYAHKYANALSEKGILGGLKDIIISGNSAKHIFSAVGRGGAAIFNKDIIAIMKLLIDTEMRIFRDLNVKVIFLQNIVTDLLLGAGLCKILREFATYIERRYSPAEAGFITMNLPKLVDCLEEQGIENPIICSPINKIGYFMNPDRLSCEQTIKTKVFRPMAMSILASGAVAPNEAIEYVASLNNIKSIVFGASSKAHITQTIDLIQRHFA